VNIHPTAVVSPSARLAPGVVVHPHCVIEAEVTIGEGCILENGVVIKSGTTLGKNNHIFDGVVLGGLPQHARMPEHPGRLVLGNHNTLREHVTIHRAMHEGAATVIGDHNLLMVNVHIAHDCRIGSHTIMANNAMLAGHVAVDDRAYLSGAVGVHQFCRVGAYAMVGGQAHVVKDIPPFVTIDGASTLVVGLNQIGLRRNGFTHEQIDQLKAAYRLIYRSGLKWSEVLARLAVEFPTGPAAQFLEFFKGGRRGFTPERRMPKASTIKLRGEALPDADSATEPEIGLIVKAG
jgi:UDP-N-acetylglucosamine acyltransferase